MRTVSKTVIGVDFGTQSARAVLVNAENGEIIYSCRKEYPYNSTRYQQLTVRKIFPVQRIMK